MADYIDREALQIALQRKKARAANGRYTAGWNDCLMRFKSMVSCFPAADVRPVKHSQWEWFDEDTGTPVTGYEREWGWRCAHCKEELPDDYDDPDYSPTLRFCPNCGARMDGGVDSETD